MCRGPSEAECKDTRKRLRPYKYVSTLNPTLPTSKTGLCLKMRVGCKEKIGKQYERKNKLRTKDKRETMPT